MQILIYIIILVFGAMLVRKNLIPQAVKEKLRLLQTISLFILLGTMGYKIGIDDKIIANISKIGIQSLIFAICTTTFSVAFTYLCFKTLKKVFKEGEK
ncbi:MULTISPECIES: hypothetical protein [Fusobacterium]|uniref:hypothetical protein n=1 Tax=Fusobacterium TaxID=848 RepID=UPI0019814E10|nr:MULTISPECIES: hypothetical protein [Fusobacterium]